MSSIKRLVLKLSIIIGFGVAPLFSAAPVLAHHCFGHVGEADSRVSIAECVDAGACLDTEAANCNAETGDPETKINDTIKLVINIFSFVVGVISVIMIIVGGLKYITSGGDSNNVAGAKNTILYAIVGLVVVAVAQIIVRFVLKQVTSS